MFETVKKNLEANGFTVSVFASGEEAAAYLNREIDGATVGMGGSVTMTQLGLKESLSAHNTLYCHGFTLGDPAEVQRLASPADIYRRSANGLAATGEPINIDGMGNRAAATLFGHEKVYFVIGQNKLAPAYDGAVWRARNVAAPQRARQLGKKTPCAVKGDRCYDCDSPERICRGLVVHYKKMTSMDMEVVLVGQELGY